MFQKVQLELQVFSKFIFFPYCIGKVIGPIGITAFGNGDAIQYDARVNDFDFGLLIHGQLCMFGCIKHIGGDQASAAHPAMFGAGAAADIEDYTIIE